MFDKCVSIVRLGLAALVLSLLVAVPAAADTYAIDGLHSSAVFKIKHFDVANFYGVFKDVSGTVVYDAADPSKSSIEVTIAATSVDSRSGGRDEHIVGPDFLNSGEFPNITFKSTAVEAAGDNMMKVTGDLTLRGVKKSITADVELTGMGTNPRSKKDIIGFEARFTVDRTQHDMGFMAGPLSADIGFILAIEAVKQ